MLAPSCHKYGSNNIKQLSQFAAVNNKCRPCSLGKLKDSYARQLVQSYAAAPAFDVNTYVWEGTDEFTALNDRKDEPPIPLPEIASHTRIVLVRHGQSTWNAEGRIQGSTNFAVLTDKGQAQAATTHEMVCTFCLPPGAESTWVSFHSGSAYRCPKTRQTRHTRMKRVTLCG
jgi:hypothetical protein